MPHSERHRQGRMAWLRAAVLGANDGIVSTASLVIGIASADATSTALITAGVAGVVAGAMSMAAGEFVSVSSQADAEAADLRREASELASNRSLELRELAEIYEERGLDAPLAGTVARKLMEFDALGAHARDELGISPSRRARPVQAASASGLAFAAGGSIPLAVLASVAHETATLGVGIVSLACLLALGGWAARMGGASVLVGAGRVAIWGALAMALTAWVGSLFEIS